MLAAHLKGCSCTTGTCSGCVCSKKNNGTGFCTEACSCRKNCLIARYKEETKMLAMVQKDALRAYNKSIAQSVKLKAKFARTRQEDWDPKVSDEEEEAEPYSIKIKEKKKKSKQQQSESEEEEED